MCFICASILTLISFIFSFFKIFLGHVNGFYCFYMSRFDQISYSFLITLNLWIFSNKMRLWNIEFLALLLRSLNHQKLIFRIVAVGQANILLIWLLVWNEFTLLGLFYILLNFFDQKSFAAATRRLSYKFLFERVSRLRVVNSLQLHPFVVLVDFPS